MKRKGFLFGFVIMAIILICHNPDEGVSQAKIPLPEVIEIVAPSSDIPKEIAAFSGRWEGNWEGELDAVLIVEEIDSEKAKVIYAWGDSPRWRIDKDYSRIAAKVISGPPAKIEWGGGERPKFIFEMRKDLKTIKGTREFRGRYSVVTMKHKSN